MRVRTYRALLVAFVVVLGASAPSAFGRPGPADLEETVRGLGNKKASIRLASARALADLGERAEPAVPALVDLLHREKDMTVYKEAVKALARAGARDELTSERDVLKGSMDLLKDQNEKLQKDVKELQDLAKEAMSPPPSVDGSKTPMLTSATMFSQLAREARDLIGANLLEIGAARNKIAIISGALKSMR